MKFRAIAILLLLLFGASASRSAENWEMASYDKAEAVFNAFDKKEAVLLTQYEPKVADFYAVFVPYQDAERKMRRYAFLKKLKEDPKSIDWTSFWNWAKG